MLAALLAACLMIAGSGCMAGYAAGTHTQELIDVAPTQASDGQALSQPSSGQVADETRPTPDPNVGRQPEPTPEESEDLPAAPELDPMIDPEKPMVALTFDDGPSKATTRILDVLEQYDAHATFFVVGTQLEKFPEITARAVSLGCEIGNHTYGHKNFTKISKDEILDQIGRVNDLVLQAAEYEIRLVRPPYGAGIKDETVKATVAYPLIMWSIDTLDWSTRDTQSTLEAIRKDVQDGSIVLMHDLYDATAAAVETIVPELIEQGYQLVTVSEMFEAKGISLEAGNYYRKAHK